MDVATTVPMGARRRLLRPGWPLYLVLVGFPLWWVLGLSGFIWQLVAVPMLLSLLRRKPLVAPPGFVLWLGFLLWMFATGIQLDGISRVIGFAYRASLYVSATIVLLYVYNSSREVLQTRHLVMAMSIFWIYVAVGGYLGLLFPSFSFSSPVETLMPHFILANDFVKLMVHPAFAEVQEVLGYASPRPSAPFVYTNDWGGAFALLIPFVILAWNSRLSRRFRMVLGITAAASAVPVIISLNRGLWLSLGVGLVYAAFRLAMQGRERAMVAFLIVTIGVTGLALFSPLKATLAERLANPHSNNRRVSLYEESIRGAIESPLFGFGAPPSLQVEPQRPFRRHPRAVVAGVVLPRTARARVLPCVLHLDVLAHATRGTRADVLGARDAADHADPARRLRLLAPSVPHRDAWDRARLERATPAIQVAR